MENLVKKKKKIDEFVLGTSVRSFKKKKKSYYSASRLVISACPLSPRRHSNFLYALLLKRDETVTLFVTLKKKIKKKRNTATEHFELSI